MNDGYRDVLQKAECYITPFAVFEPVVLEGECPPFENPGGVNGPPLAPDLEHAAVLGEDSFVEAVADWLQLNCFQ